MPGISGIIRRHAYEGLQQDLGRMHESMRHEAYYVGDRYENAELGVYLAWHTHPCASSGSMPLINQDGQRILILTGETYPDARATSSGGAGVPETEAWFRSYDESPQKFLQSLNGWFSGVAIDLRRRTLTLFNDRYGMGRIYLYEGAEEFIFASEAKAILRVRPALRKIDPSAMAQYLRFGSVIEEKSLFERISLLPAASSWVFSQNSSPEKRKYFDVGEWENQPTLKLSDFVGNFNETIAQVIPTYMKGPSPVALSLTSGLDTRVILASVEKHASPSSCYTFGGLWGETFDIQIARKLAGICHQPHQVIRLNEQFLKDFPRYAEKGVHVSDGTHDAFGAHDMYFNQIAHEIAPIRLTGKFGSEVVRVRKLIHLADFPRDLLQPWFLPFMDGASAIRVGQNSRHPLSRVIMDEIPRAEFGRVAVEQSKVILRTPYMDNTLVKLMYQAPHGFRGSRDLQVGYINSRNQALGKLPTDMGTVGRDGDALAKISHGFFWALAKSEYIYLYAMPHWLTWVDRKLGSLRPERLIMGRQKFEAYRLWIKSHFADFIHDVLLSSGTRCTDFFDKTMVEKIVRRHTSGTHNYLYEINRILTTELIYKSLLSPVG